jgi:hypothetical protein
MTHGLWGVTATWFAESFDNYGLNPKLGLHGVSIVLPVSLAEVLLEDCRRSGSLIDASLGDDIVAFFPRPIRGLRPFSLRA